MNKKIHVQTSPLTNTIFAGHVLKDGKTWAANKTDVTIEALHAVAVHACNFGEPVILSIDGEKEFTITVTDHRGEE